MAALGCACNDRPACAPRAVRAHRAAIVYQIGLLCGVGGRASRVCASEAQSDVDLRCRGVELRASRLFGQSQPTQIHHESIRAHELTKQHGGRGVLVQCPSLQPQCDAASQQQRCSEVTGRAGRAVSEPNDKVRGSLCNASCAVSGEARAAPRRLRSARADLQGGTYTRALRALAPRVSAPKQPSSRRPCCVSAAAWPRRPSPDQARSVSSLSQ
mgnify:CR=1 FL=1